eukprot:4382191-Amphidinium_carterae.2
MMNPRSRNNLILSTGRKAHLAGSVNDPVSFQLCGRTTSKDQDDSIRFIYNARKTLFRRTVNLAKH